MRARAREPVHTAWKALVARHDRPPQPSDVVEPATGRRVSELTCTEQRLLLDDWRRARMSRAARVHEDHARAEELSSIRGNRNVVRAIAFSDPLATLPKGEPTAADAHAEDATN